MHRIVYVFLLLTFSGCQSHLEESEWYVELRENPAGSQQILLRSDAWKGVFTVHGYGGYAHNIHAWCSLEGAGPKFENPKFVQNSNTQFEYSGSIIVDRAKKTVKIDLLRIKDSDGKPLNQSCPENGTYHIKRVTNDEFQKPD